MALFFFPCTCLPSVSFSRALPHSSNTKHCFFHHNYLTSSITSLASKTSFLSQRSLLEKNLLFATTASNESSLVEAKITNFDSVVDELDPEEEDMGASPWEGAVVYRRDASVTHFEYSTTLERLGLSKLSSDLSMSRAWVMGIRLSRIGKDSASGNETPVLISVDVTRRRRRLRLDGILRTVITLGCNRCAEPAAESVFSNFSLLLTKDPVEEEPGEINMGVIHGRIKPKSSTTIIDEGEEDDEKQIDEDDKLYFPAEQKEIDISKHIRDLVHVEITINAVCNDSCKGLCLECGTNLNKKSCNCGRTTRQADHCGPFMDLRNQMKR